MVIDLRPNPAFFPAGSGGDVEGEPTCGSKLEQRADVYISSLRSYIEAARGQMKIVAEFPEGEVAITNFSDVGEAEGRPLVDE